MTSPKLALDTEMHLKNEEDRTIGRVYQRPGDTLVGSLTRKEALEGLATRRLAPSITNVLGVADKNLDGYKNWAIRKAYKNGATLEEALKAPKVYRDLTSVRGSLVHKLAEDCYDIGLFNDWDNDFRDSKMSKLESYQELLRKTNEPFFYDKPHKGIFYIKALKRFITDVRPEFTHSEATVYGETDQGLLYAGTTDFIANINGITYVGDWKTSSTLQPSTALQIAAVLKAKEITTDFETVQPMIQVDKGLGVNLCDDGHYKLYETNVEDGWELFQGLRRNWKNKAVKGSGLLREVSF
jgi:hypothetical protein